MLHESLDCDIYITGSSTKLLSGELAALLAGLNARLLLRVIRDMGMPALWACLAAMAFGGGVYLAALQAMGMGWRDRGKDRESTTKG